MIRTYNELQKLTTFRERYNYLRLVGTVGESTFGFDRYLNQILYSSREWKRVRDAVILRDNGCDLGLKGYEVSNKLTIHHMNPISTDDIKKHDSRIFDPRYLICVSPLTHQAIHYGDESLLPKIPVVRYSGDTCPWK